jgi:hypothetical protein
MVAMLDLLAVLLLQEGNTANPGFVGLARFFAGVLLILTIYIGAWLFTYWISKDE